jgi:hypothetical protein
MRRKNEQNRSSLAEEAARAIAETLAQVVGVLAAIVRYDISIKVMAAVNAAVPLLEAPKRGPGRPKKVRDNFDGLFSPDEVSKLRKRRAKQLCPVPGCKGLAAPYFGMVCKAHKDVSETKIAAYRKQRKQQKIDGKASPKKVFSKKASPKKASPKKASPKKASPKKVSSKKASSKKITSKKIVSKKGAPKKDASKAELAAKDLVGSSIEAEGHKIEKDDITRLW